ncbi:hypothetical protein, partial [Shewanella sp. 10N.286.52.B9]|uniref:hypothetical protein n=1 Tax=Shewanella sp. 10N.286.52.B9 TaxID=1880837 RepID=UPI001A7E1AFE
FPLSFIVTQNYRDGILSIILYAIFYGLFNKKFFVFIISLVLLYFFRYELVYILFASLFLAFFVNQFKGRQWLNLVALLSITLTIPFVIEHSRLAFSNAFKLPLSFVGKPIPQIIAEYIAQESYYQNYLISWITFVLATLSMMGVTILILSYFFSKDDVSKQTSSWGRSVCSSVFISYILSMILYTYINDGFSLRVKLSFFPSIVGIYISAYGINSFSNVYKNKKIITAYFMLFLVVTVVNVRWVFS